MNTSRQILELQRKLNAVTDGMASLNRQAAGRELTAEEQGLWQRSETEADSLARDLALARRHEEQAGQRAQPIAQPMDALATPARSGATRFPGQSFTRLCGALALSRGNLPQAVEIATRWQADTPEVGQVLQAASRLGGTSHEFWLGRGAVTPGSTTDPVWAQPLVSYQNMTAEFIALLRAETVLGRLNGYRNVPFNIKVPRQTAGAAAGWVGEGLSKPVSRLAFDQIVLPWAKVAVIVVITQELARFSNPSAEMLVRDDLIAAISEFMDQQLLDDSVAGAAGIRPASITYAATKIPSSGGTVGAITTDLTKAILNITAANIPLRRPVWLMGYGAAGYLSSLRTVQDAFAFPSMSASMTPGGAPSLLGIPVLISANVKPGVIILLEQSELMVADDNQVMVDSSTEASLQMDSAPATPPTPLVSLWQQNLLGIKAERYSYWLMRRAAAVQEITAVPALAEQAPEQDHADAAD
jgi:HK97 family phage major capsid protein